MTKLMHHGGINTNALSFTNVSAISLFAVRLPGKGRIMSQPCKLELVLVLGSDRQILSSVPLPSSTDMKEGLDLANLTVTEWFQRAVSSVIEIAQYHATTEELPPKGEGV